MAKSIVFCADGTWNGPGDQSNASDIDGAVARDSSTRDNITNVVKLFTNLSGHVTPETLTLQNESEKAFIDSTGALLQIAKYMHGVGDSSNPIMKAIGGALGAGVIARIVRGYTFISRNYVAGDAIYIVGFSRGAYTARALAGMIATVGLLKAGTYDPTNKTQAYLRGFEAWLKCKGIVFAGNGRVSSLLTALTDFVEGAIARVTLKPGDFVTGVHIDAVGVWDTVGAMGIPEYVQGARRDCFGFVDRKLSPLVDHGFHAMALDERRRDFPVTRWDPDRRVEEAWFVGAHSDVGGGYPMSECGLSDIALDWMTTKLAAVGVQFAVPRTYSPDLTHSSQDYHEPWTKVPFNIDPCARPHLADDVFDPSVMQHWTACPQYQRDWPGGFKSMD
jgi:uncharacterized protein (DUF2235 family)